MIYTKPQLSYNAPVHYLNFMLVEKSVKAGRIAYTMMDVLGDIGGSQEAISICIAFLLIPFTYNMTQTHIYSGLLENYKNNRKNNKTHKHNGKKYAFIREIDKLPSSFNFQWLVYDMFSSCGLQECIKSVFCCFNWDNFEKLTDLMQEITEMDLELINLIDHDTTKIFQHKIPLVFKDDDMSISEDHSLQDIYH